MSCREDGAPLSSREEVSGEQTKVNKSRGSVYGVVFVVLVVLVVKKKKKRVLSHCRNQ